MSRFGAEPFIVTLAPNADSGKTPIVHTGREFVYCLEGHIAYTVDTKTYLLEPGTVCFFEAYLPHHWKNMDPPPPATCWCSARWMNATIPRATFFKVGSYNT